MRFVRPTTFAALALLAACGCRAGGADNLSRRAPVVPVTPTLDARTVIDEHNRNAERIQTLEAAPSLTITANRGRRSVGVSGHMALERPRNFKLDLGAHGTDVADIGSNDQKFWFWVRDNSDKAIYYCNYEDAQDSALTTAFQPDWIVEALGLRVIPTEEMGDYKLTRGDRPGELVLRHQPTQSGSESVTRVTIISETTHRIREHQLFATDTKQLLARAIVDDYMPLPLIDHPEERAYVPKKLHLEWTREDLKMDVNFVATTTKVNAEFTDEQREARFVQGAHRGYEPRNLASDFTRAPARGPTSGYETRPAPPAGGGVKLGEPEPAPLGVDGSARLPSDPVALSADLSDGGSIAGRLVGPAMPDAPELKSASAAPPSGWRAAGSTMPFER